MPQSIPVYVYSLAVIIIVGTASGAVAPSYSAEPFAGEDAQAQVSNKALTPAATMLTEAQIEALLREIGLGRDRPKEAAPPPETKTSVVPTTTLTDAQKEALLKRMSVWYANRTEAAPKPRPKPSPPGDSASRRYWRHSYDPAALDRGEATRLMTDELRERGVAVDSLARAKPMQ